MRPLIAIVIIGFGLGGVFVGSALYVTPRLDALARRAAALEFQARAGCPLKDPNPDRCSEQLLRLFKYSPDADRRRIANSLSEQRQRSDYTRLRDWRSAVRTVFYRQYRRIQTGEVMAPALAPVPSLASPSPSASTTHSSDIPRLPDFGGHGGGSKGGSNEGGGGGGGNNGPGPPPVVKDPPDTDEKNLIDDVCEMAPEVCGLTDKLIGGSR